MMTTKAMDILIIGEVRKAISELKNSKAGKDEIAVELLKHEHGHLYQSIHRILLKVGEDKGRRNVHRPVGRPYTPNLQVREKIIVCQLQRNYHAQFGVQNTVAHPV